MAFEMTLRERLAAGRPDVIADLYLYPPRSGGRCLKIGFGWGCPCSLSKISVEAWSGYPLLACEMMPGERRRVGFVFLTSQAAVTALSTGGRFYLWETGVIGEATIVG
ncbi:hypothetical protein [Ancylobacter rudongensis]|uniref:hypothetical protein n=1 Tax=Ancylobacter rudongensis TaxID=177413 RepID=UPI00115FBCE0|nr:hypothetical protein [Ancylobacter rudongensis]